MDLRIPYDYFFLYYYLPGAFLPILLCFLLWIINVRKNYRSPLEKPFFMLAALIISLTFCFVLSGMVFQCEFPFLMGGYLIELIFTIALIRMIMKAYKGKPREKAIKKPNWKH